MMFLYQSDCNLQIKVTWSFRAYIQLGLISAASAYRHQPTMGNNLPLELKDRDFSRQCFKLCPKHGFLIVPTHNRPFWVLCLRGVFKIQRLTEWGIVMVGHNVHYVSGFSRDQSIRSIHLAVEIFWLGSWRVVWSPVGSQVQGHVLHWGSTVRQVQVRNITFHIFYHQFSLTIICFFCYCLVFCLLFF